MSTLTSEIQTPVYGRVASEPKARFRDLCRMEWIKVASLRSTWWVLIAATVATVLINLNGVRADLPYIDRMLAHPVIHGPDGETFVFQYDPLNRALSRISVQLMMLGAAAIGALTMFGEFATGQIRTTFAAVPNRGGVMMAKVVVLTAITTTLAVVATLVSFLGGEAMLSGRHLGLGIGDHDAQRAMLAYALIVPVSALIGMLFGALIRNATASIVGVVAFLFLVPAFFGGDKYRVIKEIDHLLPGPTEDRLTWWGHLQHASLGKWPESLTEGWLVYAGWAVVAVAVSLWVVRRRDA